LRALPFAQGLQQGVANVFCLPAGSVASQAETLINQQLAMQATQGAAAAAASAAAGAGGLDVDMDSNESPPTVRLSLQLTQVCTQCMACL
jgi:hypothetical protein